MKKILFIILSIFLFTACGKKSIVGKWNHVSSEYRGKKFFPENKCDNKNYFEFNLSGESWYTYFSPEAGCEKEILYKDKYTYKDGVLIFLAGEKYMYCRVKFNWFNDDIMTTYEKEGKYEIKTIWKRLK